MLLIDWEFYEFLVITEKEPRLSDLVNLAHPEGGVSRFLFFFIIFLT